MTMFQKASLALILLVITYRAYKRWRIARSYQRLRLEHRCEEPSVDSNRLPGGLDHLWSLLTYKGDDILEDVFVPRFSKIGHTFCEQILGQRTFHTCEPQNFQTILGTAWEKFEVGSARQRAFGPFLKGGMFCTDGARWKHARDMVKPSFARSQLNDFESTERHVQNLLMTMPVDESSGWTKEVDLLDNFLHLTIDNSTEFFFGESVGSQLSNLTFDQKRKSEETGYTQKASARGSGEVFAKAFSMATEYTMDRALLQDLFFLRDGLQYRKSLATVHDHVDGIVHTALEPKSNDPKEHGQAKPCVFMTDLIASTHDTQKLRDSVLTMILGGRDTTASLLSWTFFFLARQPLVFKRLRSEILAKFGDYKAPSEIGYPSLKSIPYLQFVINETLRLCPVVAITNRMCAQDTVLPSGGGPDGKRPVAIMKGEKIFLHMYTAQRREDLWGSDVVDFRPERWEGRRLGWDFIPFGGGPRVCVGQHYGLAETSYVVLRLCQIFDQIMYTDDRDNKAKALKLTLSAGNGVRVRLHRSSREHEV